MSIARRSNAAAPCSSSVRLRSDACDEKTMNTKAAGLLILYGGFLIVMGLAGYLSNPEKARTARMSGGTFGALSIFWGVLGARRVRWSLPAAIVTTGLLALVFTWRASVGWLAVMDGHSEKWFAATLISLMLAASVALLPVLLRARRPGPSATANPEDKR